MSMFKNEDGQMLVRRVSTIYETQPSLASMFTMLDPTEDFSLENVELTNDSPKPEEAKDSGDSKDEPKFIYRVKSLHADNPFLDPLPREGSYWGNFKLFFFTVTLIAPIRLFLCLLCLLFAILFARIAMLGHSNWDKPLSCWQKVFKALCFLLFRLNMFILGYYYIPTHGKLDPNARIVVANHVSAFDGFMVCWMIFCSGSLGLSALVKAEAFHTLFGSVFKIGQCIGVDRSSKKSRAEVLEKITVRVQDLNMPPIFICPEGTTHAPRFLLEFKRGAFWSGQPVNPVCISFLNSKAGGGQMMRGMFLSFYLPCCNFINFVRVDVLPLYIPSSEEIKDSEFYAQNVRDVILEELKKHVSNCEISLKSYEDVRLKNSLTKLGAVCDLEEERHKLFMRKMQNLIMTELYLKIGIKTSQTVTYMTLFQELLKQSNHHDPNLYNEDMIKMLDTLNERQVRKIVDFLDPKRNGYIGPLEFIMFISTIEGTNLKSPTRMMDELYIIFCCIDKTCSGSISFEELRSYTENDELARVVLTNPEKNMNFDTFFNVVKVQSDVLTVFRAQQKKIMKKFLTTKTEIVTLSEDN